MSVVLNESRCSKCGRFFKPEEAEVVCDSCAVDAGEF